MAVLDFVQSLGIIPVVFLANLASSFSSGPIPNLVVQKLCSPDGPPVDINGFICPDQDIFNQATDIVSTRSTIRTVGTSITTILFGLYRDRTGRNKSLILMGELGEFVGTVMYLLGAWNWSLSPWVSIGIESVIAGLSGSMIFTMGSDCYVISNSTPEERTMRLQYFFAAVLLSILLGSSCGGLILTSVGYLWTYVISISIHSITVVLIIFFVHDKKKDDENEEKYDLLKQLRGIFKSRPNNGVFWMMLFAGTFMATLYAGEAVLQIYYQQNAFNFTVKEASAFGTYSFLVPVMGSVFIPALFIKVLKLSDFTVGIIAGSVTAIASFSMAFAKSIIILYLIATLNCMKYILNSIPQSIFSRCITDRELGLYVGFVSITSIFLPFGINYLYRTVFNATTKTMPGAFLFITSAGCFLMVILYIVCYYWYVEPKKEEIEESTNSENGIVDSRNHSFDEDSS